jgi:hypothetical protein
MKKPKSHARAKGETQIPISLPVWLKKAISALASDDRRSRSQWIVIELEKSRRASSKSHKRHERNA